jgi:hypothetical protein
LIGDTTEEDVENEAWAISALCDGKCKYVVEVFRHGWLVHMSLYFIDMEYCDETLEKRISTINRKYMKSTPEPPNDLPSSRKRKLPNKTNPTEEEVRSLFKPEYRGLTNNLGTQYEAKCGC